MIEASGACRVVALSSTSVLVKSDSSDQGKRDIACRLAEGEQALRAWAGSRGIEWVILRPTWPWAGQEYCRNCSVCSPV